MHSSMMKKRETGLMQKAGKVFENSATFNSMYGRGCRMQ